MDDANPTGYAAVREPGHLTEHPAPTIDTLLALVKLRARTAGCYGA